MKSFGLLAVFVLAVILGAGKAGAQAPPQVYRVGVLSVAGDPTDQSPLGAGLIRGFARQGFVLGKNLEFVRRAAHGQLDRLPQLVDELVAAKVAVIVTMGYPAALAAKQHTKLPVVVVQAGDPVADGLVASFARPGGHVTGISEIAAELSAKRLALLQEAVPKRASGGDAVERRRSRHVVALQGGGDAGAQPRASRSNRSACARPTISTPRFRR